MARMTFITGSEGSVGKSTGTIAVLDFFKMRSRMISPLETDTASPNDGKASGKDVKGFRHLRTHVILVQSNRLTLRIAWQSATFGGRADTEWWHRNCALQISDNEVCNHAPAE